MLTVDAIATDRLELQTRNLVGRLKISPLDGLKKICRYTATRIGYETQPFGDRAASKKQGEAAIRRDLVGGRTGSLGSQKRFGIFFSYSTQLGNKNLEVYKRSNNVRLFVTKDGRVFGTEKNNLRRTASNSEMRAHHKQYFRNGRMSQAGANTRDIGRWRFVDQMVVNAGRIKSYIREQQKKVGFAKGAWAGVAAALGGMEGLPSWVRRHMTAPHKVVILDHPETPQIIMSSSVSYGGAVLRPDRLANAVRVAGERLVKQMEATLRAEAKKAFRN